MVNIAMLVMFKTLSNLIPSKGCKRVIINTAIATNIPVKIARKNLFIGISTFLRIIDDPKF